MTRPEALTAYLQAEKAWLCATWENAAVALNRLREARDLLALSSSKASS